VEREGKLIDRGSRVSERGVLRYRVELEPSRYSYNITMNVMAQRSLSQCTHVGTVATFVSRFESAKLDFATD